MKKRLLSGMRPTGVLHLGHLVGALDNWVNLQDQYQCLFMIADWHALMSEYENPTSIRKCALDNVIDWLSCGIDPKKSILFIQSEVVEHLQLHMILSCISPLGWLLRCPTYKEQLREIKNRDINTYGFLGYPVLQASDILLYKVEFVPVGEDQLPHLELAREITRRFNSLYKKNFFAEPEAILTSTPRLLGIDGRKMSKSYNNTINLSDSEDFIKKKVKNMFTDPKRIKITDPGHPDECNVYSYYKVFAPHRKAAVYDWCINARVGCTECKEILSLYVIEYLKPIREKRKKLLKNKKKIKEILEEGKKEAQKIARKTIDEIKDLFKI